MDCPNLTAADHKRFAMEHGREAWKLERMVDDGVAWNCARRIEEHKQLATDHLVAANLSKHEMHRIISRMVS